MSDRANWNGKALSLMIVSLLAVGGLLGVLLMVTPAARADTCGQSSGLLTGNWFVTMPQTCTNINFSLDGNLYIRNGGSLTLINGGIAFVQDRALAAHIHALFIDTGGSLSLVNSTITTATNTLSPYVKLAATVNGTLAMTQGSVLKFPGTLNLNAGSVLNMTASKITGFSASDLSGLGTAGWIDDNDDSAAMTMNTATAYLFQSRIEKLYENTTGGAAKNLTLFASTMYAYDTYIGLDFTNNWQIHNIMSVDTTSKAYLYNVTVDELQSAGTPQYQKLPVYVPAGGGAVYLLRWANMKTTDPYGTVLQGAKVWSHLGSLTAQYPDNGSSLAPGPRTLWYIGRTWANWNTTNAAGLALIPLWTDTITVSSLPNANSFGSYEVTASYTGASPASGAATFPSYPSITAAENSINVVIAFSIAGVTPDLTVLNVGISGGNGNSDLQPLNTIVTITATIHDTGQNPVTNVPVDFFSTNVDTNNDGIMDSPVSAYQAAGLLIATKTIASVPANGNASTSISWTVSGSYETSMTLSIVVNPPVGAASGPGSIPETNLRNNIARHFVTLFVWPDLAITGSSDVLFTQEPVSNNDVPVTVTVHNLGTGAATGAKLLIREGGVLASNTVSFTVGASGVATMIVLWHPTSPGYHNITFYALTANTTIRNVDYNFNNSWIRLPKYVFSQPDLAVYSADFTSLSEAQNRPFSITVRVHNLGQTPVANTSVAVYLNGNYSVVYGRTDSVAVVRDTNITVNVRGIPIPGPQHLTVVVNPDHTLIEGGLGFANDYANISVTVTAPQGTVVLDTPKAGATYGPTDDISVTGVVRDTTSAQNGIPGLTVTIVILSGTSVMANVSTTTDTNGIFLASVPVGNLPDGTYTLRVSSSQGTIAPAAPTIYVKRNVPFLNQQVPLLGIPWWLFLVIIAAVAAIVIGVTVYFKVYGLGKMVECGECGAFIPEDATVCPKCGVEFEKDMAKCSNCQAWIPVDVKQCPECGVEFATGEVEMADYQEKMRLQYDEVVQKFKEDASRQLGRALSDKEFQEWWRKQPTFVTFEDWLREEEEMRKMGSKPCPVCGTLNSVTATVCHKCGSLMKEDKRPPSGGTGGVGSGGLAPAVKQRAAAAPGPTPPPSEPQGGAQGVPPGQEAIPRRVIRKPVTPAPVVQKKVIKRPMGEGEQADTAEGTDQSDQSTREDEL